MKKIYTRIRSAPVIVLCIVIVSIAACSGAEMPSVRPAPTNGLNTFQLTDAPIGDSVISIAIAQPTPTPYLTDSGFLMYDDFNTDGDLDLERWQGQLYNYSIQGGVLSVRHDQNTTTSTFIQADSIRLYEIGDEGETRFSVESRIMSPEEIYYSRGGLVSGIQLRFTDNNEHFFQIG